MPPKAYLYGIPYSFYEEDKIRRYGFHGTSHRYIAQAVSQAMGKKVFELKIISCHLGNGGSVAAIEGGKSVDTSMGMTPLEGLMMGTRCGDIDPAIVTWLAEQGKSIADVNNIMNKQSGILGVAGIGSSDMRDLLAAVEEGNEQAITAFKMFTRRIIKYIGSYAALLGRTDAIIFTGGIGEYGRAVRAEVVNSLEFMDTKLNEAANEAAFGSEGIISTDDSKVAVVVMPTDEELKIAQSTIEVINK